MWRFLLPHCSWRLALQLETQQSTWSTPSQKFNISVPIIWIHFLNRLDNNNLNLMENNKIIKINENENE